jgi:type IV pilus assembly protein PilB
MKNNKVKKPARDGEKQTQGGEEVKQGLLDMNQAAALLKTSRPTFFRWVRAGKIRGAKAGRQWRFTREELDRFLKGQAPVVALAADIKPLLYALAERLAQCGTPVKVAIPDTDPVAEAVRRMILLIVKMKASDLHIIPTLEVQGERQSVELRYRVDGVLHTVATLDPRLLTPIIEQWKRLAACNIHENRCPQDGRIIVTISEQVHDLRVNFLPLCLGESVTARVISGHGTSLDLDGLGYTAPVKARIEQALRGCGMIVVTGPTGSGKTTTLYALAKRLVSPSTKIVTIEDPVEYMLPGVAQVQVMPSAGLSFNVAVRAALRSAPNAVLIGEIRDQETLSLAQESALNGHLVLTALHTRDAASALRRMLDIGSPAFHAGSATKLVVAQRLIRTLCPQCSKSVTLSGPMLERVERIEREGGLDWGTLPRTFRQAVGCKNCYGTGYRGRTVIAEALEVTSEIAEALERKATDDELNALAVKQGMISVAAHGMQRAAAGETTVEEVLRFVAR